MEPVAWTTLDTGPAKEFLVNLLGCDPSRPSVPARLNYFLPSSHIRNAPGFLLPQISASLIRASQLDAELGFLKFSLLASSDQNYAFSAKNDVLRPISNIFDGILEKLHLSSFYLRPCMYVYVCIEVAFRGVAHGKGRSNWAKGRDSSGSWVQCPNFAVPSIPRHARWFVLTPIGVFQTSFNLGS